MMYEKYEKRVMTLGKILNVIYKFRIPIISVASVGAISGIAVFSTSGLVGDVTIEKTELQYGESLVIKGTAFNRATTPEYFADGEWTTEEPVNVGQYKVRLRAANNFGGFYYSDEFEYTITGRDLDFKFIEGANVVYGDTPKAETEMLIPGDYFADYTVNYDDLRSFEPNIEVEKSTIVIKNKNGIDVTRSYNITTYGGKINFVPRQVDLNFEGAEKPYDGTPLTKDIAQEDLPKLPFGDSFVMSSLASPSITELGSISTTRSDVRIVNNSGVDVTDHYSIKQPTDKTLTVTKRKLTITSKNISKTYDGKKFNSSDFEYDITGGTIKSGDKIVVDYENADAINPTNGSISNKFSIKIYDSNNVDVTEGAYYDITPKYGSFEIKKRDLSISLNEEKVTKTYDRKVYSNGLSLTASDLFTLTNDTELADGDRIEFGYKTDNKHVSYSDYIDAFELNANDVFSIAIKNSKNVDVTSNYVVNTYGKCGIEKVPLKVTTYNRSKYYDGTEKMLSFEPNVDYSVSGLLSGDNIVFLQEILTNTDTANVYNIGVNKNYFTIKDAFNNDVSDNYSIDIDNSAFGKFTIKKPTINIDFTRDSTFFNHNYDRRDNSLTGLLNSGNYNFYTDSDRSGISLNEALAPNDYVIIDGDLPSDTFAASDTPYHINPTIRIFNSVTHTETSSNYNIIQKTNGYDIKINKPSLDINLSGRSDYTFTEVYSDKNFNIADYYNVSDYPGIKLPNKTDYWIEFIQTSSDSHKNVFDDQKVNYSVRVMYRDPYTNIAEDVTNNFVIPHYDYKINITPRDIDFDMGTSLYQVLYDGEAHNISDKLNAYVSSHSNELNLINGHNYVFSSDTVTNYNGENPNPLNYTLKVTNSYGEEIDLRNYFYDFDSHKYTIKILRREIDIQFVDDMFAFEYDGKIHSIDDASVNGAVVNDMITSSSYYDLANGETIQFFGPKVKNVDDYDVGRELSYGKDYAFFIFNKNGITDNENYIINTSYKYVYEIERLNIDVRFAESMFKFDFDGETHSLQIDGVKSDGTIDTSKLCSGYVVELAPNERIFIDCPQVFNPGTYSTISFDRNKDCSQYYYNIKVLDASNANVSFNYNINSSYKYQYVINSRAIDIHFVEDIFEFEYDDNEHSIMLDGFNSDGTVDVSKLYAGYTIDLAPGHQIVVDCPTVRNVDDNTSILSSNNGYTIKVMYNGKNVTSGYNINTSYNYQYKIEKRYLNIKFDEDAYVFEYDSKTHNFTNSFANSEYDDNGTSCLSTHKIRVDSKKSYTNVYDCDGASLTPTIIVVRISDNADVTKNYNIEKYSYVYDISKISIDGYYQCQDGDEIIENGTKNIIQFTYDGQIRNESNYVFCRTDNPSVVSSNISEFLAKYDSSMSVKKHVLYDYDANTSKDVYVTIADNENYIFNFKRYEYQVNKVNLTIVTDSSYFTNWIFDNHTYSAEDAYKKNNISVTSGAIASTDELIFKGWEKKYNSDVAKDFSYTIIRKGTLDVSKYYVINGGAGISTPPSYRNFQISIDIYFNYTTDNFSVLYDGKAHSINDLMQYNDFNINDYVTDTRVYSCFEIRTQTNAGQYGDILSGNFFIYNESGVNLNENFDVHFYDAETEEEIYIIYWQIDKREIEFYLDMPGIDLVYAEDGVNHFTYDGKTYGKSDLNAQGDDIAPSQFVLYSGKDKGSDSFPSVTWTSKSDGTHSFYGEYRVEGEVKNHSEIPTLVRVVSDGFRICTVNENGKVVDVTNNYNITFREYYIQIDQIVIDIDFNRNGMNDEYFNFVYDGEVHSFQDLYDNYSFYETYQGESKLDLLYANGGTLTVKTSKAEALDGDDRTFTYYYNPITKEYESGHYCPRFVVNDVNNPNATINYLFVNHGYYSVSITPLEVDVKFLDPLANPFTSASYYTWNYDGTTRSLTDLLKNGSAGTHYTIDKGNVAVKNLTVAGSVEGIRDSFTDVKDSGTITPIFKYTNKVNGVEYDFSKNFVFEEHSYTFTINPIRVYVGYKYDDGNLHDYSYNASRSADNPYNHTSNYGEGSKTATFDGGSINYEYDLDVDFYIQNESDLPTHSKYKFVFDITNNGVASTHTKMIYASDSGTKATVAGIILYDTKGAVKNIDEDNFIIYCNTHSFTVNKADLFKGDNAFSYVIYNTGDEITLLDRIAERTDYDWNFFGNDCIDTALSLFPTTYGDALSDCNGSSAWVVNDAQHDGKLHIKGITIYSNGEYVDVTDNYSFNDEELAERFTFIHIKDQLHFVITGNDFVTTNIIDEDTREIKTIYDGNEKNIELFTIDTNPAYAQLPDSAYVVYDTDLGESITYYKDGETNTIKLSIYDEHGNLLVHILNADGEDITDYILELYEINGITYYLTLEKREFVYEIDTQYEYILDGNYHGFGTFTNEGNLAAGDEVTVSGDENVNWVIGGVSELCGPEFTFTRLVNGEYIDVTECYDCSYSFYDRDEEKTVRYDEGDKELAFIGYDIEVKIILDTTLLKSVSTGVYTIEYCGKVITAKDVFKVSVVRAPNSSDISTYTFDEFVAKFNQYFPASFDFNNYLFGSVEKWVSDSNNYATYFGFNYSSLIDDYSIIADNIKFSDYPLVKIRVTKKALDFDLQIHADNPKKGTSDNPIKVLYNGSTYGYSYEIKNGNVVFTGDFIFRNNTTLANGDTIYFYKGNSTSSVPPAIRDVRDSAYYTDLGSYMIFNSKGEDVTSCYSTIDLSTKNYYIQILKLEIEESIEHFEEVLDDIGESNEGYTRIAYENIEYSYEDYSLYYKNVDGVWVKVSYDELVNVLFKNYSVSKVTDPDSPNGPTGRAMDVADTPTFMNFAPGKITVTNKDSSSLNDKFFNNVSIDQKTYKVKIYPAVLYIDFSDDPNSGENTISYNFDGEEHRLQDLIDEEKYSVYLIYDDEKVLATRSLEKIIGKDYEIFAYDGNSYENSSPAHVFIQGSSYERAYIAIRNKKTKQVITNSNYEINNSVMYEWKCRMPMITVRPTDDVDYYIDTVKGIYVGEVTFDGRQHGNDCLCVVVDYNDGVTYPYYWKYSSYSSYKSYITFDYCGLHFEMDLYDFTDSAIMLYDETASNGRTFRLVDYDSIIIYDKYYNKFDKEIIDSCKGDHYDLSLSIAKAEWEYRLDSSYFEFTYDGEYRSFNDYFSDYSHRNDIYNYLYDYYNISLETNNLYVTNRQDNPNASYGLTAEYVRSAVYDGMSVSPSYGLSGYYYGSTNLTYSTAIENNFYFPDSDIYTYRIDKREVYFEFNTSVIDSVGYTSNNGDMVTTYYFTYDGNYRTDADYYCTSYLNYNESIYLDARDKSLDTKIRYVSQSGSRIILDADNWYVYREDYNPGIGYYQYLYEKLSDNYTISYEDAIFIIEPVNAYYVISGDAIDQSTLTISTEYNGEDQDIYSMFNYVYFNPASLDYSGYINTNGDTVRGIEFNNPDNPRHLTVSDSGVIGVPTFTLYNTFDKVYVTDCYNITDISYNLEIRPTGLSFYSDKGSANSELDDYTSYIVDQMVILNNDTFKSWTELKTTDVVYSAVVSQDFIDTVNSCKEIGRYGVDDGLEYEVTILHQLPNGDYIDVSDCYYLNHKNKNNVYFKINGPTIKTEITYTYDGTRFNISDTLTATGETNGWLKLSGNCSNVTVIASADIIPGTIIKDAGVYTFELNQLIVKDKGGNVLSYDKYEDCTNGVLTVTVRKATLKVQSKQTSGTKYINISSLPEDVREAKIKEALKETLKVSGLKTDYDELYINGYKFLTTTDYYGIVNGIPSNGDIISMVPDYVMVTNKVGMDVSDNYNIIIVPCEITIIYI